MMRTGFLFVALFVITLIGGLIAFAPLSFALRQSGIADRGVSWQQARPVMARHAARCGQSRFRCFAFRDRRPVA